MLGYSNTRDALYKHVEEEDKTTVVIPDADSNYKSKTTVISESDDLLSYKGAIFENLVADILGIIRKPSPKS